MHSTKGGGTVDVRAGEDSGRITVWRDGEIVAQVDSNADGGRVSVHSAKDARSGVVVWGNSDGGEIIVFSDGKIATLEDGNVTSRMPRGGT